MIVEFEGDVYRWAARRDDWYFAAVPAEQSEEIAEIPRPPRGFGSVRVRARIGGTEWTTSIFPGDDGRYVLPLKRAVRDAEEIADGDRISARLELVDL